VLESRYSEFGVDFRTGVNSPLVFTPSKRELCMRDRILQRTNQDARPWGFFKEELVLVLTKSAPTISYMGLDVESQNSGCMGSIGPSEASLREEPGFLSFFLSFLSGEYQDTEKSCRRTRPESNE